MNKILIILVFLPLVPLFAQADKKEKEEAEMIHKLSFSTGITFVPKTISLQGDKEFAFVPTLGLDYNFDFHKYMGIGFINEFELGKYFIERDTTVEVEREYAYSGIVTFNVFPFRNFSIFVGGGAEIDKHQVLPIISAGLEYELNFGKNWFGKMALQYNYLFKYSSIGFQVGFGYAFFGKGKD